MKRPEFPPRQQHAVAAAGAGAKNHQSGATKLGDGQDGPPPGAISDPLGEAHFQGH